MGLLNFKSFFIVCVLFCISLNGMALEEYPLSRNDSATIKEYNGHYEEQLKQNHKKEASRFLNLIAMIYWEKNHFKEAESYFLKSLKLNQSLDNQNGIAMLNNNLAMLNADMAEYEVSLEYFEKTLLARRVTNEKIGIISALINRSVVHNKLKKYDESIVGLKEALDLAREMNDPEQMRSCYGMLSETYEKAGDTKQSLYYYDYFKTFNELVTEKKIKKSRVELDNERLKREISELQLVKKEEELHDTQEELESTQHDVEVISEKQRELIETLSKKEMSLQIIKQEAEIEHLENSKLKREKEIREMIIWMVSLGLLLVLGLLIFLFVLFKQKNKLNKELIDKNTKINEQNTMLYDAYKLIEEKNYAINESIEYAKYIQESMLNRNIPMTDILPNSFVYYRPLDTVSGDFYWYAKIDHLIFVVMADCTGHGVPGGFITMVGNNQLNNIIKHDKVYSPDKILYSLDAGIRQAFNQEHTHNMDGMDLSVVKIDTKENTFEYSGAQSAMIMIQNDEIEYIKPSPHGVGGTGIAGFKHQEKEFDVQTFDFKDKETYVYLFTDGVIDQFNSSNERKFLRKRLKNVILDMYQRPMEEQKETINKVFNDWKGNTGQTDDVSLLGFKLN